MPVKRDGPYPVLLRFELVHNFVDCKKKTKAERLSIHISLSIPILVHMFREKGVLLLSCIFSLFKIIVYLMNKMKIGTDFKSQLYASAFAWPNLDNKCLKSEHSQNRNLN